MEVKLTTADKVWRGFTAALTSTMTQVGTAETCSGVRYSRAAAGSITHVYWSIDDLI